MRKANTRAPVQTFPLGAIYNLPNKDGSILPRFPASQPHTHTQSYTQERTCCRLHVLFCEDTSPLKGWTNRRKGERERETERGRGRECVCVCVCVCERESL